MPNPRVLVVDDEVGLCMVLQDALEFEGYEVELCNDADTARKMLSEQRFDIAMVDVFLTEEPVGLELGRFVLSNHPKTSLMFMTGYAEESDIKAGVDSGAFTCIRKPYALDDVIRIVGSAIDGSNTVN